jgi:exopolyphosphatase/guanosine-5'-triphosphate,3'-diphosphate pyrophosphatase
MSYYAAIDIGSNAMRLAILHKTSQNHHISFRSREPVRLGTSVFDSGIIEKPIYNDLKEALGKFKNHLENHNVCSFRAVATSAMREAKNNSEIVDKLFKETGVKIEIISGEEEAKLVARAIESKINLRKGRFLLIDIGGGSIELIVMENGEQLKKESFVLGTVRLLQLAKTKYKKKELEKWLPQHLKKELADYFEKLKPLPACVGTGGNMDRFIKLKEFVGNTNSENFISDTEMKNIYKELKSVTYSERITKFCLKPDRADVIIPAAIATNTIMEMAGAERIYLPQVGLSDGVLYELCSSLTN